VSTAGDTDGPGLVVLANRWRALLIALVCVAALVALGSWYLSHPAPLALREGHVTAVTAPGRAVYVGAYQPGSASDRTIEVAGVHVHADATVPVTIDPLLCRGGSISVTSDAAVFCTELLDPVGQALGPGDSIVLRISADEPGAAFVGRVAISYRDGLRAATRPAGTAAVVAFVPATS
jgi:hypothetical protein